MSTVPLTHPETSPSGALATARVPASRAPALLAAALLLLMLYAAFAHGAASNATDTRIQLALALVAVVAGAAGIWSGSLRFSAPRLALAGIALLAGFAVWSGVTILWSVAPDQTWIELNRALTYVIVLCLAVALGASDRRALRWIAVGFFLISLLVTVYALGQKVLPGLHLWGLVNLNQSGPLPRLQEPFGYWNALALFVATGVPIALALVTDWTRLRRDRLAAVVALVLMLLTIGLTYSRGGMIALVVSLIVGVALSGARLRSLMWLAAAAVALIAPLAFALSNHSLTTANVALGRRETAGLELLAILLGSLLVLIIVARRMFVLEATVQVSRARR